MTHTYFRKILILPDAGTKNPFQYLLIDFLRKNGLKVFVARKSKLFTIYTAINKTNPEAIYFDWVHSFILGKSFLATLIKSITFLLEIIYLHYVKAIPIIHTVHNTQNHKGLSLKLERVFYRFFLLRCTRIRVYSEAVKREVIQIFGISQERILVVQDVPFHHYYPNTSTKKDCRLNLGFKEKDFLYLFFGRIEPYKGIEDLIRAFLGIVKHNDYLIIAGENLDKDYLSKLRILSSGHPNIIWHNEFIEKDSVQYFFNAADIVVLPFTRTDHSGSIDLSLSFAKPVITLATEASCLLLAHQLFLLFQDSNQLAGLLQKAKKVDLHSIGNQNFNIADSAYYFDLLTLFQKVKIPENEDTIRHEYI